MKLPTPVAGPRVAPRARATAYLVQTILSARILADVYLVHTAIGQANEAGNISLDVVAAMSHRLASPVADDIYNHEVAARCLCGVVSDTEV